MLGWPFAAVEAEMSAAAFASSEELSQQCGPQTWDELPEQWITLPGAQGKECLHMYISHGTLVPAEHKQRRKPRKASGKKRRPTASTAAVIVIGARSASSPPPDTPPSSEPSSFASPRSTAHDLDCHDLDCLDSELCEEGRGEAEESGKRRRAATAEAATAAMARPDCSSLPPSPPATPVPLVFAPRSWPLPARLGASAPMQVSLALLMLCAAIMAELPKWSPDFFFTATGFAVMIAANRALARVSPRLFASAMTLLLVCGPTLRLVNAVVRSPAVLTSELDKLAEAGRYIILLCGIGGSFFGALPPAALPSSRKRLAVAYFVCTAICGASIFRFRTRDERMPSFRVLHSVVPFLVSFITAQAVSGSKQEVSPPSSQWPAAFMRRSCATHLACAEC